MSGWIYAGRFLHYLVTRLILLAVAVGFIVLSFFVCMDYMNVNILIRDGFNKRAATIMHVNEDASVLVKVFTKSFIEKDTLLKSHIYDDYVIRGFTHNMDVDFKLIFPWDKTIEVDVTERIPDIDGELPAGDNGETGESTKPPEWQDGRYRLTLSRDGDNWRITDMTVLAKLPKTDLMPSAAASCLFFHIGKRFRECIVIRKRLCFRQRFDKRAGAARQDLICRNFLIFSKTDSYLRPWPGSRINPSGSSALPWGRVLRTRKWSAPRAWITATRGRRASFP